MILPPRLRIGLHALAAILFSLVVISRSSGQAVPTATGPGSYTNIGLTGSALNITYGQRWAGGGSVYLDANLYRQVGAEVELQTLRLHEQGGIRQTTYLVGPRYSFRSTGFNPYVKVLAGVGTFVYPYGYGQLNYFVIAPAAGVDYDLLPRIKLRLINFEYQDWLQFTYGSLHPYGVSAGISFRVF
jgi:hypothetical protein